MLGTIHWITPSEAVPLLCTVIRSLLLVTWLKVIWLKVSSAVGWPCVTEKRGLPKGVSVGWQPYPHGGGATVGPGVIRHQRHVTQVGRLVGAVRAGVLRIGPVAVGRGHVAATDHDAAVSHARRLTDVYSQFVDTQHAGDIDGFQGHHERAALDRDASAHGVDPRIGLDEPRRHRQAQNDFVASLPKAALSDHTRADRARVSPDRDSCLLRRPAGHAQ